MAVRLHPFLLSLALLMIVTACSTTSPGPSGAPVVDRNLPPESTSIDSEAQNRLHDPLRDQAARSMAEIAELSGSMSDYQPDRVLEILQSLESVPSAQLISMIDGQLYQAEFTEWLELALQIRTLLINGRPVTAASRHWADYHYGHIITRSRFSDMVDSYGALFPVPSQVAILLPADGGLAAAADAIRDGILSAYLDRPGDSTIRFYSSGEDSESAVAAYLQAKADGATQIIGPLRIASTRTLGSLDNHDVPILLLNEPTIDGAVNSEHAVIVNSLTLSRSEEAAAIASNALAQGQKTAIVIVPDSPWGKRIESTFTTIFEQGEGQVIARAFFDTSANDHSAMLTQILKIDESKQRKTDLQSRLGIPLTFEPNRRDDFDFVFMAANPLEGRELKPLLRFHDAGDIPVYAMGRIFSGKVQRASDQDLNGIVFPTTRWQLEAPDESILKLDSVRGGSMGNLYALGEDAWHLLPWLPLMQKDPDLLFPGQIGTLQLQSDGRIFRQPVWAKFYAGRPVPYQWPDNH